MHGYHPSQTFFLEPSPPSSPVLLGQDRKSPAIRVFEAPELISRTGDERTKRKIEHRRWKSVPTEKPTSPPFSYEYHIEDGRLAGLAELNPERDFLHYSSSRNTSRNASARTSQEASLRPSLDLAKLNAERNSAYARTPPLSPKSPRRSDSIKRAMSLRHLKGRKSVDETKSSPRLGLPPSPYLKPEIESLASCFGPNGPKVITAPFMSPRIADDKSPDAWEAPRPAPRPPMSEPVLRKQKSMPFRTIKANESLPRVRLVERKPSLEIFQQASAPGTAVTSPMRVDTSPVLQPSPIPSPRHLIRRKTSRFLEHIDGVEKPRSPPPPPRKGLRFEEIPPVPPVPMFLPPFDFQLPPQPDASPEPLVNFSVKRSPRTSPVPRLSPTFPALAHDKEPVDTEARRQNISAKRSAIYISKDTLALPRQPRDTETDRLPSVKRSMSTRTVPAPKMADVCMAQVRPVALTSPVVAHGHARIISC